MQPTACAGVNQLDLFTSPCRKWDLENQLKCDTLAVTIAVSNNTLSLWLRNLVPSNSIPETVAGWLAGLQTGWNLWPFLVLNKWRRENCKHARTGKDPVSLRCCLKQLNKDVCGKNNHSWRPCFTMNQRGFGIEMCACVHTEKQERAKKTYCLKPWKTNKHTWL